MQSSVCPVCVCVMVWRSVKLVFLEVNGHGQNSTVCLSVEHVQQFILSWIKCGIAGTMVA